MQPSPQFTPPEGSSSGQGSGVWIFVGCGALLLLLLCAGSGGLVYYAVNRGQALAGGPGVGPGGAPVGPGSPAVAAFPSRTVSATITMATGNAPVPVGTTCNFVVSGQPSADSPSGVLCRAQVVCGGQLLFGGPEAGYFICTVADQPPSISGSDPSTTAQDGVDAAMSIDTAASTLTVHDDGGVHGAYSVTARIDSVL